MAGNLNSAKNTVEDLVANNRSAPHRLVVTIKAGSLNFALLTVEELVA